MKNKLKFLTKISLNKKLKTKWFLVANLIFAVLIIGLINVDYIIKLFGGDFDDKYEILVIDNIDKFDEFKNSYLANSTYAQDYEEIEIIKYNKSYDDGVKEIDDNDNKILLVIDNDLDNYIKATLVSKDGIGSITDTLINITLNNIRSNTVINKYNLNDNIIDEINEEVDVEKIVLSEDNFEDSMMASNIMQIITLPIFMLIIFLVQMIGAEVNEEKSTKSMEIIISNVSPKIHFISKIIASNLFVIIQGLLLIVFAVLGIGIRYFISGGNLIGDFTDEINLVISDLSVSGVTGSIGYMLPIILIMTLLTFLAYSLLAGILASMTTNLEDFQQLQTPIVIICLIGYYLSMMAGLFNGSIFIKIMSYVPFVSSMLAPTLYVMGQISLFDLIGSIILLILVIYLLIKYGLRIYKVGILNYSGTGLWKKMFKAVREK